MAVLKSTSDFEHFLKQDEPHSLSIFEFIDSKRPRYLIVEKVLY